MCILLTIPAYIYKCEQWKYVHNKIISDEFESVYVCVIFMGTDLAWYVKKQSANVKTRCTSQFLQCNNKILVIYISKLFFAHRSVVSLSFVDLVSVWLG